MTVQASLLSGSGMPKRQRLVRDGPRELQPDPRDQVALQPGAMYRISYSVGGSQQRRVTRSVAVYSGQVERRVWDGELIPCLDFALPQGRTLSLLASQLVDARPAVLNERGQWVLSRSAAQRRRAARRQPPNPG
jgi:hypothetical protein